MDSYSLVPLSVASEPIRFRDQIRHLFARDHLNQHEQPEQVGAFEPYGFPKPGSDGWPTTRDEFGDKWNISIEHEEQRQKAAEIEIGKMKGPEQDRAKKEEEDMQQRFRHELKVFRIIFDMWTEEVHRRYRELWREEMEKERCSEKEEVTREAEAEFDGGDCG